MDNNTQVDLFDNNSNTTPTNNKVNQQVSTKTVNKSKLPTKTFGKSKVSRKTSLAMELYKP